MNPLLRLLIDIARRFTRSIDGWLIGALLGIMAIGLAVLYSAGGESARIMLKQGAFYGVGMAAMWIASRVPPAQLRSLVPAIYVATLIPLVAVLFIGGGKHGNHWIDLGVVYFQPAEMLKLSLPMMAAWYLSRDALPPRWRTVLMTGVIIAIPVGLILLQKDFGTAMLVAVSGGFVLFLAGLSWWWFGAAIAAVAAAAPIAWFWLLRPYQKDRVMTFLDPESDPLGSGWNLMQSKIAIGSGFLTGKGWGQGSQSHLDYLPEHTTDFIFAVLAEEFGWLGVALTLSLYLFVIARCLMIAVDARDSFARLLAGSLGLSLCVYVIVNAGMISGLLPVVGVTMPLLSYGGTSVVSILAAMGVVMAMRTRKHRLR